MEMILVKSAVTERTGLTKVGVVAAPADLMILRIAVTGVHLKSID